MSRMESQPRAAQWCARLGQVAVVFFACLMLVIPQRANAAASAPSLQPTTPPGWQMYTNPLFGYQIAYPSTWRAWGGDLRFNQHFTNYDPTGLSGEFPPTGTFAKIDLTAIQKPINQSLNDWLVETDADLWPGGPSDQPNWVAPVVERNRTIAGSPAIVLRWDSRAPRVFQEFLDAGSLVYGVSAYWSTGADAQLVQQVLGLFQVAGKPHLTQAAMPAIGASTASPLITSLTGLNLPLKVVWASCCWTPSVSMNSGGVNSWFDHEQPNYSCNGTMTRYDGYKPTSGCGGTNCTGGVSCYDGHDGFDFSTRGQNGIPVYAASSGTLYKYSNSDCGNYGIVIADSQDTRISTKYCHLQPYLSGTSDTIATSATYIISFSDGTANLNVTFNQNNYASWYTIYDWYSGGHPISQIKLGDNTGIGGQELTFAKIWFSCITG